MQTYSDVARTIAEYCPGVDQGLIERAYRYADEAHAGVLRKSGEPYIIHPIATAEILARLQLDAECIAAGLLHDVPEDTACTLEDIEREFGPVIAKLVDGVTKLGQIRWPTPEEQARHQADAQAENLRKMFLAMVDDVRVVLVKLADRLHNMRTLDALPLHKQQRIARETLEIYAPLASRLGIWQLKSDLEDLSFRYLEPEHYRIIDAAISAQGVDRDKLIAALTTELDEALRQEGIEAEISGRPKHLYSIAKKMQRKGASFDTIYDVVGVRVIVKETKDCYAALGIVHSHWYPIPGEFDDYIAKPKESHYQSLHTAVLFNSRPLEIQIRTHEMHRSAEFGIAAHWRYKENARSNANFDGKIAWLRQLLELRDDEDDAQAFVERLKSDLFQDLVYVFTPRGNVIELPVGATPIDFAYRIHTDVGHHCVGAKVNGNLVPLDTRLQNGQVVEVLTRTNRPGPSRDWLNPALGYIQTATAREKVRQWFRRQDREANIVEGRDMLDREIKRLNLTASFEDVLKFYPRYPKLDDFLAAIGYGAVTLQSIIHHLTEAADAPGLPPVSAPEPNRTATGLDVQGIGNLLTNLARCCNPVPGDQIIGFITRGKGITVHRTDCPNIRHEPEKERLIAINWGGPRQELYPVTVRIEAWDRVGLLRDVSTVVADDKVNMTSVLTTTHADRTVTLLLTIQITNVSQLSRLLTRLEGVRDVYDVRRELPKNPHATSPSSAP